MNQTDTKAVCALRAALWPKAKWGAEEMALFAERVGLLSMEYAQAVRVLREVKATRSGWPAIAVLLEALKAAAYPQGKLVSGSPIEVRSRADYMRHLLAHQGITGTGGDGNTFRAFWLDSCYRSMRIRGDVPESYRTDYFADAPACGVGQEEAGEVWDWIMEQMTTVEKDEEMAAYIQKHASKEKINAMIAAMEKNARGDKNLPLPEARMPSLRKQKNEWLKRRVQLHEVAGESA